MRFKLHLFPSSKIPTYQHDMVTIAEGLQQLGYKFYGNGNYWYDIDQNKYLIEKACENFEADCHIYNTLYFEKNNDKSLANIDRDKINILLDFDDGYKTFGEAPKSCVFDIVLKTHYNKSLSYPKNVYPWAFGLSNRMIAINSKYTDQHTEQKVFINYRVNYNTRKLAHIKLSPKLSERFEIFNYVTDQFGEKSKEEIEIEKNKMSYWWQTHFRHDEEYYKLLNESVLTYCFGGPLIFRELISENVYEKKEFLLRSSRFLANKLALMNVGGSGIYLNYQFDSWRFWEAMISNSCPIHMDFESWNFLIPEMPTNGKHYFGLKNLNFDLLADNIIKSDNQNLREIALNGRSWAIKHYSPQASAQRLVNIIEKFTN